MRAPICRVCVQRHWAKEPHKIVSSKAAPPKPRKKRTTVVQNPTAAPNDNVTVVERTADTPKWAVKVLGAHCRKCGHDWVPRDMKKKPGTCPKCKVRRWDRSSRLIDNV